MGPVATIDWAEVRRLYDETDLSLKDIMARCQVSESQLRARRAKERWPPRPRTAPSTIAVSAAGQATITAAATQPARSKAGAGQRRRQAPTLKERRLLLYRLYEAIVTKVSQLEQRTLTDAPSSITDYERETRALATMIRNFERVMEAEAEIERSGRSAKSGAVAAGAADLAADAERWRNEVAERLARLRAEHQPE